jgi:hypothetical protein
MDDCWMDDWMIVGWIVYSGNKGVVAVPWSSDGRHASHCVITDGSGLTKFFETDHKVTHTIQCWKLELLRLDFSIVHRPGQMLIGCDMLSRCNAWTSEWRTQQEAQEAHELESNPPNTKLPNSLFAIIRTDLEQARRPPSTPMTHVNPKVTGNKTVNRTLLAKTCDRARTLWIIGQGSETATIIRENLGLEPLHLKSTNKKTTAGNPKLPRLT